MEATITNFISKIKNNNLKHIEARGETKCKIENDSESSSKSNNQYNYAEIDKIMQDMINEIDREAEIINLI